MKKTLNGALIVIISGLLISGCAGNRDLITQESIGSRQDVFTEIRGNDVPTGKALADIVFSVKSNSSLFLWNYNKHTDPPYRVHLSIDGQSTILEAEPVLEDKSPIGSNYPESGTGWKYQFRKRIALAPGKHKLTIALPVDDVLVEREIVLREGVNMVMLQPRYNKKMLRPHKGENFAAGIKSVEVLID
ncbi:MAG: hypothetical protein EG822_09360 [Deltaproteobacteria bacterium]|nr:hypothetical protein [Deltaproteobacteria bacterium]TLN03924.1 MAG: hypothetical protein FDZ73_05275 [bacterium]